MITSPARAVTILGRTNTSRNDRPFGIRQVDRRSHFAIIGKTGTGKSTLLESIVLQDIAAGRGCTLLDPHGDLVRSVWSRLTEDRRSKTLLLDATDPGSALGLNPLAFAPADRRALAGNTVVEVFKKLWSAEWGPRLEHLLRNVVLTLLERSDSSLDDIPTLLTDSEKRRAIVVGISDSVVKAFWTHEYDRYSPNFRSVVIAPLQNKLGLILTDPVLRRALVTPKATLDLRGVLDDGRILLVNLDKGSIGEGPSATLGSFLLSHLALAAMTRGDVAEHERRDYAIVMDEFQTFTTLSVASMLAELRKFRVGLIVANQHLAQLDPAIRDAVFGNVGSLVSFRVGAGDASYLAREFAPTFDEGDLLALPNYHMYLRLLIDGQPTCPFSATTLQPTAEDVAVRHVT